MTIVFVFKNGFERRKICDKCRKTINTDPISNTAFPMITISRIRSLQLGWESIDLCPECSKIFEGWLEDRQIEEERKENETE